MFMLMLAMVMGGALVALLADQDGQVENDPEILLTRSPRNCQFEAD